MSNGNVFAVTAEQAGTVQLKRGDRQQVVFNAQNLSGRPLEGRARVIVEMPAQQAWYTVQGRTERKFGVDEVHQLVVEVAVPAGTQEGRYAFALEVDSVERPDEDYGRSENVLVVVSVEKENGKRLPKWKWALAAGAVVVVVGGLVYWIVTRDGGLAMPQLVGQPVETAMESLESLGLEPDTTLKIAAGGDGLVLEQDPDSGTVVSKGTSVALTVADASLTQEAENLASTWYDAFRRGDIEEAAALVSVPFFTPGRGVVIHRREQVRNLMVGVRRQLGTTAMAVDSTTSGLVSEWREAGLIDDRSSSKLDTVGIGDDDPYAVLWFGESPFALLFRTVDGGLELVGYVN